MSLPVYQSHKKVCAAKIKEVVTQNTPMLNELRLKFSLDADVEPVSVDAAWVVSRVFKGKAPQSTYELANACVGGYFVVYDDGYTSWSPAKAFEDGYTPAPAQPVRGEVNSPFPPAPFRPVYRQLHAEESDAVASIKDKAADLWDALNAASTLPNVDPRCLATARTKLEECVMWATKAVTK